MFNSTPTACPDCGKPTVVPVVYGYPGPAMFEAVERNSVLLGGCVVPRRYSHGCTACGWRSPSTSTAHRPWQYDRSEPDMIGVHRDRSPLL